MTLLHSRDTEHTAVTSADAPGSKAPQGMTADDVTQEILLDWTLQ